MRQRLHTSIIQNATVHDQIAELLLEEVTAPERTRAAQSDAGLSGRGSTLTIQTANVS